MPNLYIVAGCNGAGKTTASFTVLPEMLSCKEFVNADSIAAGLSPFNPESVAIEAARLMLSRIQELLDGRGDFAFETTLAIKSYVSLVKEAQAAGYKVTLLFNRWMIVDNETVTPRPCRTALVAGVRNEVIFVTNLSLNLLKRPEIGRFHFLYWELTGAREVRV